MLSLFFNIVWQSNWVDRAWKQIYFGIFSVAIMLTYRSFVGNVIEGDGSGICFIRSDQLESFLYTPLTITGTISFTLFVYTIGYILVNSYVQKKTFRRQFWSRVKPFQGLLGYIMAGFTVYCWLMSFKYLHYFQQTPMTVDLKWIRPYLECVLAKGACEEMLQQVKPKPYSLFLMRFILLVYRMSLIVAFGWRRSWVQEWKSLYGKRVQESPDPLPTFDTHEE